MNKLTEHYRQLLGLDASWEVSGVSLSLEEKQVEITPEEADNLIRVIDIACPYEEVPPQSEYGLLKAKLKLIADRNE